jgi:hypothetical protein
MKTLRNNQQGFGYVLLIAIIIVAGLVAFVGVRVMHKSAPVASVTSADSKATAPSTTTSSAEIQRASQSLDDTSADSGISGDQLDSDLDSLL